MKNYIIAILLAIFAIPSFGQSISIFDIDTTNFPTMKAKFYAFDKDGKPITPSISDLKLSENGINRTITNISCPTPAPPKPLSSVLVIDVSGSMYANNLGVSNMDIAKSAANVWVNTINLNQSECAITSFDNKNYLNQDFTNDRNRLLNSIAPLNPQNGTDYDAALLLPLAGGLQVSKKGKHKKIIVLITDGNGGGTEAKIIEEANKQNCTIYCVTIKMKAPEILKNISSQTGGQYFENVKTIEDAEKVYKMILYLAEYSNPCELTWESGVFCITNKINVELNWNNIKSMASYISSVKSLAKLDVVPNYVNFGFRNPNNQYDTIITLKAINADIIVKDIKIKIGTTKFSIVNINFPFVIAKDQSIDFILRFSFNDSSLYYSSFVIETDKCDAFISANGGFLSKIKTRPSIKLTIPNGKETFIVGYDTIITWDGISVTDTVTLEYSFDKGVNWNLITKQATNLRFNWQNVPLPSSNKCLVRITQNNTGIKLKDSVLTIEGHNSWVMGVAFSPDGSKIATASWDSTARIWDSNTGVLLTTLKGITTWVNGITFSPDGNQVAAASLDRTVKLWDIITGANIKVFNGHTYFVNKVVFSPDGRYLASASGDSTAIIWEKSTGKIVRTLKGHKGNVYVITFSPDGNQVATSSGDRTAKIWDLTTGNELQTLRGHTDNVTSIAFSPNGNRIATVSWDKTIKVWDSKNGFLISTYKGHNKFINSIVFSPDGKYIATTSGDSTAIIWDIFTGNIIRILKGHKDIVYGIAYSQDGRQIATSSADHTAKIWELDLIRFNQDISDTLFAIVAPSPASSDIDMKKCVVSRAKDSIINNFIVNKDKYQFGVDSIYFSGADAGAFSLVSGLPKYNVLGNSNEFAEIRFAPNRVGLHSAKVIIITTYDTLVQNIVGEGVASGIEVINNLIDYGNVSLGKSKDSLQAVTIKNISSSDILITDIKQSGPNYSDFSILSNTTNILLKVGDTLRFDLKYTPSIDGRVNGSLSFEFNEIGTPAFVQLYGRGIDAKSILSVDSSSAYMKKEAKVTLRLTNMEKLIDVGNTHISAELVYNKTMLYPKTILNRYVEGDSIVIKLDSLPLVSNSNNLLKELKFTATLGNAEETLLSIRNVKMIGADAAITVVNGNFKLLGVCYEGGERFLVGNKSKSMLLAISPNPATESIEIEYSNADEGTAEIIISNYLGQTILTQKLEKTQIGKTKLDLSQIPTGQYVVQFKTETVLENKMIQLIK